MPGTGPIGKAHRQLERARPMRTPGIRALVQPGHKQAACGFSKARLAREMPCLRECHQFQVTVQLPEILDVADDTLVPVVDTLAEIERCLHAGLGIEIPARRKAEGAIAQGKQVPPSGEQTLRGRDVWRSIEVRRQRRNPCRAGSARAGFDMARKTETPALKSGRNTL